MKIKINIPRVPLDLISVDDFMSWRQDREEEEGLSSLFISEEDVTEENFSKIDISSSKFVRCRFLDCDFEKASFVDVIFENCDFSNSRFSEAYFSRCEFHNCKCLGTDFHEAVLKNVGIANCVLRYANLNRVLIESINMEECDLTDAALSEMKYKKWSVTGSKFVGCNFFKTKLRGFDFSENELADIIVSDSMEELKGAKISPVQALEVAKLLGIMVV